MGLSSACSPDTLPRARRRESPAGTSVPARGSGGSDGGPGWRSALLAVPATTGIGRVIRGLRRRIQPTRTRPRRCTPISRAPRDDHELPPDPDLYDLPDELWRHPGPFTISGVDEDGNVWQSVMSGRLDERLVVELRLVGQHVGCRCRRSPRGCAGRRTPRSSPTGIPRRWSSEIADGAGRGVRSAGCPPPGRPS